MGAPRLHVLGSGNAFNDDGRASPCLWVEPADAPPFLVDVGPGAGPEGRRAGLAADRLDRVFLTHLHGDHTAGWPFLLLSLVFRSSRTRALDVWGPVGTQARLSGLEQACYPRLPERREFALDFHELTVDEHRGLAVGHGMRLDVLPMKHAPSSIGLRFHLEGRTVAVSGDTEWCANLERLADGCDLLVLECSAHEIPGHVSLAQLRRDRRRLDARICLLVHLEDAVGESLARDPLPGVLAAHDGMTLEP